MKRQFWNWVRNEDGTRTLTLDGVIAEESWFDDDVTPKIFREQLNAGTGDIVLWVNSPGGDCVAASQIYTMLMEYKGNVTVKIDGIAASAASVIAMAGTEVLMAPTSLLMLHNPLTVAIGDSEEMQKAIAMLDEVKESIINAYALKTGLSRLKILFHGRRDLVERTKSDRARFCRRYADAGFGCNRCHSNRRIPVQPQSGNKLASEQDPENRTQTPFRAAVSAAQSFEEIEEKNT